MSKRAKTDPCLDALLKLPWNADQVEILEEYLFHFAGQPADGTHEDLANLIWEFAQPNAEFCEFGDSFLGVKTCGKPLDR